MGVPEHLPDLVRNPSKFDAKVEMVLNEIIQSEKKYVKTLNTIVEVSWKKKIKFPPLGQNCLLQTLNLVMSVHLSRGGPMTLQIETFYLQVLVS